MTALALAGIFWCLGKIQGKAENWRPWFGLLLCMAILPWIRIYAIFVFPAIVTTFFVVYGLKKPRYFLVPLAAIVPSILLWWHWGNLAPPQFMSGNETATPEIYRTGFGGAGQKVMMVWANFSRIPSVLTHVGLYMLPWIWYLRKNVVDHKKLMGSFLIVALVLNLIVPLGCAGAFDSMIRKILHLSNPVPFVSASELVVWIRLVYAIGTWSFIALLWLGLEKLKNRELLPVFCVLCWLFYALSLPFTGVLYVERYTHPMHVVGVVYGLILSEGLRRTLWPWIPGLLIGLAHSFGKSVKN
jgi:hypothetical protein